MEGENERKGQGNVSVPAYLRAAGLHPVAETLLAQRAAALGITGPESLEAFLSPRLANLHKPADIAGLPGASEALEAAVARSSQSGAPILIIGDYDVDGITSTAIAARVLQELGASVHYIIPNRFTEGYGLTPALCQRALAAAPSPAGILVLDCGTNACQQIQTLHAASGTRAIVVDHHQPKDAIISPQHAALLNPHAHAEIESKDGDESESTMNAATASAKNMCTAGLMFKLGVHLMGQRVHAGTFPKQQLTHMAAQLLDLVAMGTVADAMPLVGENRIFAYHGCARIARNPCAGIAALKRAMKVDAREAVNAETIGFRLAPPLNALGRLGANEKEDATLGVHLMLASTPQEANNLASTAVETNTRRKGLQQQTAESALESLTPQQLAAPCIIARPAFSHPGVVGIVASKLVDTYGKPAIVFAEDTHNPGMLKGSARGTAGVNLAEYFKAMLASGLLETGGGHKIAAACSLRAENFEAFCTTLNQNIDVAGAETKPTAGTAVDVHVPQAHLNAQLYAAVQALGPFSGSGGGHPSPVLGITTQGNQWKWAPRPFKPGSPHYSFAIKGAQGCTFKGVAYNAPLAVTEFAGNNSAGSGNGHPLPFTFTARLGWDGYSGCAQLILSSVPTAQ